MPKYVASVDLIIANAANESAAHDFLSDWASRQGEFLINPEAPHIESAEYTLQNSETLVEVEGEDDGE